MNSEEYLNLDRVEAHHWYYSGKRRLVKDWIKRTRMPAPTDVLLDCGAGTGRFAQEMEHYCQVLVLDDHEEALRLLRTRFRANQILTLKRNDVPLPDGSLEYVTALDVLEHVPADAAVVQGFHRLLKPGGLAVVTVPAGMALWSDWDVALHHFRRYNRRQLSALFRGTQWEIVHVNYTNVAAYPVVWCVRKWRTLRQRFGWSAVGTRREDRLPPHLLNTLLRNVFVALGKTRLAFPFGVSLILVARRRP